MYPDDLDEERLLKRMTECSPHIATAYQLAQRFRKLSKEKDVEDFGKWMENALQSGLPDFESLAAELGRKREAVEAALKQPWSCGEEIEGHISRLKFKSAYGRANFELLRQRVLSAV